MAVRKSFELIVFSNVTRYIYPEREQTRFCLNTGEREIESNAPETQRLHGESAVKPCRQSWLTRLREESGEATAMRRRGGWGLTF